MPFFIEVPACPNCKSEFSRAVTQARPGRNIGNDGRPYYHCKIRECKRIFYSFNDDRGIHADNPLCFCGEPSRRIVAGKDHSLTSDSYYVQFQCAKAACKCMVPEQDQGRLMTVAQTEIQNWVESGKV